MIFIIILAVAVTLFAIIMLVYAIVGISNLIDEIKEK
jgi:Na+-transporting methylmalonyl-CoA/oxaloacetate decarboxylase gamma subunit